MKCGTLPAAAAGLFKSDILEEHPLTSGSKLDDAASDGSGPAHTCCQGGEHTGAKCHCQPQLRLFTPDK